jgi:hypothetical protein
VLKEVKKLAVILKQQPENTRCTAALPQGLAGAAAGAAGALRQPTPRQRSCTTPAAGPWMTSSWSTP